MKIYTSNLTTTSPLPILSLLVCMILLIPLADHLRITSSALLGNDIKISNTQVQLDTKEGHHRLTMELQWKNSWKTEQLFSNDNHDFGNWDAIWMIVKYQQPGGPWKHAKIATDGFSAGTQLQSATMSTNATMSIRLRDDASDWHRTNNPGIGAILHPAYNTVGDLTLENVTLRWDYAADGLARNDPFKLKVIAIEMVYIPPGSYYVGNGPAGHHSFTGKESQFHITNHWDGCIANSEDCLWSDEGESISSASLPANFPKGLDGFYIMKYETSQQQYVDFLNMLPVDQAAARAYVGEGNRHGITFDEGQYKTSLPHVANHFVSWVDAAAYLDWAGLRPITELEYEKAARGPLKPVSDEYAWGGAQLTSTGGLSNYTSLGEASETVPQGNAIYDGSNPDGPSRVGIFATGLSDRQTSGGSYFGVMDMSGNVEELVISVSSAAGRAFTGTHGNGSLSANGTANEAFWPGGGTSGVEGSDGVGRRGGCYSCEATTLSVSSRLHMESAVHTKMDGVGFRGARTIVTTGVSTLTVRVEGQGSVSPASGLYNSGVGTTITATPENGWEFVGWSGDASGTDNPLTVTMDEAKMITALFGIPGKDYVTEVVEVTNSVTGKTWMDRNLGASRAATSSTDTEAYGDLYQWGRASDGHEKRDSVTTNTLSSSDSPGHGEFIIIDEIPYDWRNPQNDNLWQGEDGINNPCPAGYRIPTEAEWEAERQTWSSENSDGAYASPLKLSIGGFRYGDFGEFNLAGTAGVYWSSSVDLTYAQYLLFFSGSGASVSSLNRSTGASVRCTKDEYSLEVALRGNGSVTPVSGYFDPEATVTVTATPENGWEFVGWSGDASGTDNPLTVTMDEAKMITALFGIPGKDYVTEVVEVINSVTGKTWMDRNLGASRAATSSTDTEAYGDLYQWGRASDGHEKRSSGTTITLSSSNSPTHENFITPSDSPYDWRNPQNDNLWQGEDGINNPCPAGYRIPTEVEWSSEVTSWSDSDRDAAYASVLQLTTGGYRYRDGTFRNVDTNGYYWSSNIDLERSRSLSISSSSANMGSGYRSSGNAIRCIKD